MTTTDTDTVALDDLDSWIELYASVSATIAALDEKRRVAREHIEAALGDAETGTVAGIARVRWAHVTSTRLDQAKAKGLLKDYNLLEQCMVESSSRRFVLVDPDEQP